LGYDSETNKHVLMLISYKDVDFSTREYRLKFNLRYVKDKAHHSVNPPPRPITNMTPTHVDGKIFWMVEPNLGPISPDCEIVGFDVRERNLRLYKGPRASAAAVCLCLSSSFEVRYACLVQMRQKM
jgi:hypothetical protein